jgi:hypothetical protein
MSKSIIKKFKFHWAWQDDKLEQWLQAMAKQGLHLQSVNFFCIYTFVKGDPADVCYRIDYATVKKDDECFALYQDAGWEHVIAVTGWQYWRKAIVNGKVPEIFTDTTSKQEKYRRLLVPLAIGILPMFLVLTNSKIVQTIQREQPFGENVMFSVLGVLVALYIYVFINIFLRIRQLKREYI